MACWRQKFEVYQNANMSPLTSGKTCYITKYFQRKPERKRRKSMNLQIFVTLKKKLIRHCYLEAWVLCSTNSFLFFKKREGRDQMMILLPILCLTPLPLLKNHQSEWGRLWCIFFQSAMTQICSLIHGNGPKEETQKLFMILLSVWKTPSITSD